MFLCVYPHHGSVGIFFCLVGSPLEESQYRREQVANACLSKRAALLPWKAGRPRGERGGHPRREYQGKSAMAAAFYMLAFRHPFHSAGLPTLCRPWQTVSAPSPALRALCKESTGAHMSWGKACIDEGSRSLSFIAFMVNLFLIKRKRGTKLYVKRNMLSKKKKKRKSGVGGGRSLQSLFKTQAAITSLFCLSFSSG